MFAVTSLSALALQQCLVVGAFAAQPETGRIILAQAAPPANPNDPKEKEKAKQKQQAKPSVPANVQQKNLQTQQPPAAARQQPQTAPIGRSTVTTTPQQQPQVAPIGRSTVPTTPQQPYVKPLNAPRQLETKQSVVPIQPRNVQPKQLPAVGTRELPRVVSPVTTLRSVDQVRSQRQVRVEGNQRIIVERDRRMIVRDGNKTYIRNDETSRFRAWGPARVERHGNERFAYVRRPDGYQIITVTDANGRLLRRMRRGPDGREVVLINNGRNAALATGIGVGLATGLFLGLAAPAIAIPREQYIVDVSAAPRAALYDALDAPPLVALERAYTLDEIRYNAELRDRTRRLDVDSITFASGSWEVTPDQSPQLEAVAEAMQRILARKPDTVFLIEGHTDAVGNDDDNLSLSDRRAESVAVVLSETFQVPPENLVTQGYGEQFLKVPTDGPNRANRRVTVRNITYLLAGKF